MANDKQVSSYLDHLPAIFQQEAFLGRFLLAFEQVLTGLGNVDKPGREEVLGGIVDPESGEEKLPGIHHYFDPKITPIEFLEWLSGWVALSLRTDLNDDQRRDFIANAVPLYRLRGTKPGLAKLIPIYTALPPVIDEVNTSFQIGVHSTIGVDTVLDGGAPHFFKATVRLPTPHPEERKRMKEVVTAIIDLEKPAHTQYKLEVVTPTLQIGVNSRIGEDTLLGPPASR